MICADVVRLKLTTDIHPSRSSLSMCPSCIRASLSLALVVQENMISCSSTYHPTRSHSHRTSYRGTRCPVQQVRCALFQASHESLRTVMFVVEGVVVGFTAFVARWRTQMAITQCFAFAPRALPPSSPPSMPRQLPRAGANVETRALRHRPTLKFRRILASWKGQQNSAQ